MVGYVNLTATFKQYLTLSISSECDDLPTNFGENLRTVLLRSINKNQILILNEINKQDVTISKLVNILYKKEKISVSTLKLNAQILRKLNLITFGNGSSVKLTEFGNFVLKIMCGGENDGN